MRCPNCDKVDFDSRGEYTVTIACPACEYPVVMYSVNEEDTFTVIQLDEGGRVVLPLSSVVKVIEDQPYKF